jgi:hypothetical protein
MKTWNDKTTDPEATYNPGLGDTASLPFEKPSKKSSVKNISTTLSRDNLPNILEAGGQEHYSRNGICRCIFSRFGLHGTSCNNNTERGPAILVPIA